MCLKINTLKYFLTLLACTGVSAVSEIIET